nr:TM0106 family RecB-like putative nuclease [Aestuariimicrobium ganziense]
MILLDAYAARNCPVKTQNAYDPTVPAPELREDQVMVEVFLGSQVFKDEVLGVVAGGLDGSGAGVVDLRPLPPHDKVAATLAAMDEGVDVVIGPRLPHDDAGHRRGSPDVLVRHVNATSGRVGYLPVQVKRHRLLEKRVCPADHLALAPLATPRLETATPTTETSLRSSREADLIQVAHYWRMLESMGRDPDLPPTAGLIGTDTIDGAHPVVWVNLTTKFLRTFSRTSAEGWRLRSALERYDHEFGFRVTVAQRAEASTDGRPASMVHPIRIRECESCRWWERCAPKLPEDDLSLRIDKAPLDVREISVLRKLGVSTLEDLVKADLDELLPAYLPEVRHRDRAEDRLRLTKRRAELLQAGVNLQRISTGELPLPGHELEIDVDIETSADDTIYLWGFLVDDRASGQPPYYKAFVAFDRLDPAREEALAVEAMQWLTDLVEGRDAQVHHYSDYELVHLRKLAERNRHPVLENLLTRRRELFHDLFLTVRDHYFGVRGLGLKVVAAEGPGFAWRDEDPSGLASQSWFAEACDAEDEALREAARTRVLEYNEDDVRATHAVRAWLRRPPPDAG